MPGLLALHAHPDDESLSMGGTLAKYAAAGEHVVVVTATGGEEATIFNHDDPEALRPRLREIREQELQAAAEILGLSALESLGYRDSGMKGAESNQDPACFWQADFTEAVGRLVRLVRTHRPEVMTAYDPFGGYGHPDHIQVHRVGTAAFFGAADVGRFPAETFGEPWEPLRLFWATWPRRRAREARRLMVEMGEMDPEEAAREPEHGTRDEDITTEIDVREFFECKWAAVLAHHTQIAEDSWFRTMPEDLRREGFGRETYIHVFSRVPLPEGADDLFAGLR
jgi:N-acetyl-1-D-myo-inositol-2-amino-2-deoxy-alpha-D-glucopyranoside deacetylase